MATIPPCIGTWFAFSGRLGRRRDLLDGELVRKDGIFLPEDLQGLNPESLGAAERIGRAGLGLTNRAGTDIFTPALRMMDF
jgi:hypothetical protein